MRRKLPCVQSQLIIEMERKGRKKKPKAEQFIQSENCTAQTEPEMKEVTLAVVTSSETNGNSSIDDEVEVGLTEFNKATNDTQQQPKIVSTQFHRDFLLNNQQLNALKRHHRIAEKLAGNYSVTSEQGPRSTRASKKTVKRRPEQLPQQDFTPEAETEERQQESTAAAWIGEAQQFSPAAEIGEAQQFTPAAEIGEAQHFTPAAENGEAQLFTPAAEIGEAQQFTPAAEIGEAQQGGEHNQFDGLPHEYSENLIDEISEVPSIGFVNDTLLTFIDLPVAATETARESDTTDESKDESDSEIEFRITEYRNNNPERPNVEVCLLCMKEVKKMRDHLTNKHTIGTENKLRKFISTYHRTLQTNRCYQCSV